MTATRYGRLARAPRRSAAATTLGSVGLSMALLTLLGLLRRSFALGLALRASGCLLLMLDLGRLLMGDLILARGSRYLGLPALDLLGLRRRAPLLRCAYRHGCLLMSRDSRLGLLPLIARHRMTRLRLWR